MNAPPLSPTKRRWGRLAALTLGSVGLLVAALYAAVVIAFPPERLAVLLAEEVTAATGRDLRIGGGLSISVLPTIAVRADDVVLGNIEGGSRPEMVRVRHAAFELSPVDLLRGRFRILRMEVEGVDLLLESNAAGRANWQFAPRVSVRDPSAGTGADARVPALKLHRAVVKNARIAIRGGQTSAIHMLDIESFDLVTQGDHEQLSAVIAVAGQRWKLDGHVGSLDTVLLGMRDLPIDLRLVGDGASMALKGTIGTGSRAGSLAMDLTGRFANAATLTPFAAGASALPMPIELRASLSRTGSALRADPLQLSLAGVPFTGDIALVSAMPVSRLEGNLRAGDVEVARLLAGKGTAKRTDVKAKPSTPYFDSTPLPFPDLPNLDLRLAFKVERLQLPRLLPLSAVEGKLTSSPGRFALDDVRAGLAGGTVRGRMSVALGDDADLKVALSVDAKSLSIRALEAVSGRGDQFRGGRADLSADLVLAGSTPKSLAASATGNVRLSAADVEVVADDAKALNRKLTLTLLELLMPRQSSAKGLVIECAVARLPFRRGVAAIDRSIAMETREVALAASGQVNLVDQTIRLEFKPQAKKGLGVSAVKLARLVVSGPLQDPNVGLDAIGAAFGAADVGVTVASSGLSHLVTRVVKARDGGACDQASTSLVPQRAISDRKEDGHHPGGRRSQ